MNISAGVSLHLPLCSSPLEGVDVGAGSLGGNEIKILISLMHGQRAMCTNYTDLCLT